MIKENCNILFVCLLLLLLLLLFFWGGGKRSGRKNGSLILSYLETLWYEGMGFPHHSNEGPSILIIEEDCKLRERCLHHHNKMEHSYLAHTSEGAHL